MSKLYEITITRTAEATIYIEAESEEEAKQIVTEDSEQIDDVVFDNDDEITVTDGPIDPLEFGGGYVFDNNLNYKGWKNMVNYFEEHEGGEQ